MNSNKTGKKNVKKRLSSNTRQSTGKSKMNRDTNPDANAPAGRRRPAAGASGGGDKAGASDAGTGARAQQRRKPQDAVASADPKAANTRGLARRSKPKTRGDRGPREGSGATGMTA